MPELALSTPWLGVRIFKAEVCRQATRLTHPIFGRVWLGKKAQAHPLLPGRDLGRAVHSQARYRCPANRGEPHNGAAVESDLEMVLPPVCTWVEQTHHCFTLGITAADMNSLIEIAGAAGQRPVRRDVLATTGNRHNMLHFQGKVEHGFWCMAILTP